MQEELNQFIANDVWELVPQPRNMTIVGTKWVFRNKLDENVARLESISILLAYACALDFKLFQMDVKSAFLNGFINEEVYVAQPPGFIDFEKLDHVYKLKKALYGLKQAHKACVCLCARFQEAPKTSHLEAVKRIFRYIKGHFVVNFVIQNKSFSLTIEEFGHILKIPFEGYVSYTNMWSLDYLEISTPSKGRYKTTTPSPSFTKSLIQTPRHGQVTRTRNKKTVVVNENEILTRKIQNHMKSWVEIIHENVLCLGGHRDHVPACLCHMLYCIETSTQYNLAFFILKRIERTRNKPKELLPYGMLLTRLFNHVVSNFPELAIDRYILYDRVMHSLAPITSERRDRIMARKEVVTQILALPLPLLIIHPHLIT
ncbi:pentatricopeptide repeat-containing protein [Tanacetum coccineum]|uniref:Pentatricopeptide repeat-containing protein n=1 Tax=Tanacetum coccineum TaxID=301880 RepID=A0ABQ5J747_9ASTR